MKRIIVLILMSLVFVVPVCAEEYSTEEFLNKQAELSGADELNSALPNEAREFFAQKEISAEKSEWTKNLTFENTIKTIFEFVKDGIKAPFLTGGVILAIIFISAALSSVETGISANTASFAVTAAAAAVIISPILHIVNSSVTVMQNVANFMVAFVPVFAVIVVASGKALTGTAMSALLLGAAQGVELVANHFIIPLMCGYLSISVASGVSPLLSRSSLAQGIKKFSFWIMSFVTTVFIGVLSIQTAVNASADSLATRTAKFVIGSTVPVAGTVLSEALTTVTASLGILKTSVAIYGVVACCIIFLPILVNLILWRVVLNLTAILADIFSVNNVSLLLKSVDTAISVLCGIILLTCAMFIISLTVVVSVGRTV